MAKIKKLSKKTKLGIIVSLVSIMMLFLVTPSAATDVGIWGPPIVHQGESLGFYVQINIYHHEQVPIDFIRVDMNGAGSAYVKFNPNGDIIDQSGGFDMISASFPSLGQGYGYCWNQGYGYGYAPEYGYGNLDMMEGAGYGYGYGYGAYDYRGGYYPGVISLTYLIQLDTTGMAYGMYYANAAARIGNQWYLGPHYGVSFANAVSRADYEFVIAGYGGGGGGGGRPETATTYHATSPTDPCCFNLSGLLDWRGRTLRPIELDWHGWSYVIPPGALMLGPDGKPLTSVCFTTLHTPPVPEGWAMVGNAIEFEPSGATFDPAFTAICSYDPANVPEGASESDIVMAYWDGANWVNLKTTVNTQANTASASIAHFTPFALLTKVSPAAPPPEEAPPTAPPAAPPAAPPEAPPAAAAPIAWWIWVIVGVVVVGIVVGIVVRRRAA